VLRNHSAFLPQSREFKFAPSQSFHSQLSWVMTAKIHSELCTAAYPLSQDVLPHSSEPTD